MEALFIFLMLVAAVASRNVPKEPTPDFVPSKELLDSIFNPPASQPTESPLEVPPETDVSVPSETNDSNDTGKDTIVEVNLKIRIETERDKDEVSVQEDIKLNGNATKAGEGKAKPKNGLPKVTTRFVDRVAFGADACAAGTYRVGGRCSQED
ncbi:unnamed protein product [Chrysodeixis includens]|uniref:Uncharacterized protein n=1 Tax=Chrysodeixis includens TaxID=689277 RepID=A0A9P0FTZ7_CHRIL|nr:unnamed protein product [Chrysodeixis includens]